MRGIDAITGKELSGFAHLKQSIRDILTTPIGSRIMLRDYGSRLFELVDAPLNNSTIIEIYAAVIESINKWEPRIKVVQVFVEAIEAGKIVLRIDAEDRETGEKLAFGGLTI